MMKITGSICTCRFGLSLYLNHIKVTLRFIYVFLVVRGGQWCSCALNKVMFVFSALSEASDGFGVFGDVGLSTHHGSRCAILSRRARLTLSEEREQNRHLYGRRGKARISKHSEKRGKS